MKVSILALVYFVGSAVAFAPITPTTRPTAYSWGAATEMMAKKKKKKKSSGGDDAVSGEFIVFA